MLIELTSLEGHHLAAAVLPLATTAEPPSAVVWLDRVYLLDMNAKKPDHAYVYRRVSTLTVTRICNG